MRLFAASAWQGAAPVPEASALDIRNVRLQYLRAAAASAVLVYHAAGRIQQLRGTDQLTAIFNEYWGAYGVSIFFALSGYLMAELLRRDDAAHFLVSRIARIYPAFLLVVGLFVLAFAATGFPRGVDLLGLSLVPLGGRDYFLGRIEWTLVYEMTYYTGLALLAFIGLRRLAAGLVALWVALILGLQLTGHAAEDNITPLLSELPLQTANLPFLLGFLLSSLKRHLGLPPGLAPLALIAAIAMPYLATDIRIVTAVPAVLIIAAAIRSPKAEAAGFFGRFGARLGDASYVLYLCHVPLVIVTGNWLPQAVPEIVGWLGFVVLAIALSLILVRADLSMHRWLKRRIAQAPGKRLRVLALAFAAVFVGLAGYAEIDVRGRRAELAQARALLASSSPVSAPGVLAEIDSVATLPGEVRVVRGYAIDPDRPNLVVHAAILQNGRVLMIDRTRRMRTALARSLSRPDIANIRFGFVLTRTEPLDCSAGPLEARAIFQDGRVVAISPGPLAEFCPPKN